MPLFGKPNAQKLAEKRDLKGLAKALANRDADVRREAAQALERLNDPSVVPLIAEQLSGQVDDAVLQDCVGVLRAMAEPALPVLVAGLNDAQDKSVLYAALLGRLGEQYGLAPLLEASRSADLRLRANAVAGLGLIGTAPATDRITEMFREDDEGEVRQVTVLTLTSHKLPGAYETFMTSIDSPDPMMRGAGVIGLGALGDPRAAERLREVAAQDENPGVRNAAASALTDLPGT